MTKHEWTIKHGIDGMPKTIYDSNGDCVCIFPWAAAKKLGKKRTRLIARWIRALPAMQVCLEALSESRKNKPLEPGLDSALLMVGREICKNKRR